jgi:hypothetical protein
VLVQSQVSKPVATMCVIHRLVDKRELGVGRHALKNAGYVRIDLTGTALKQQQVKYRAIDWLLAVQVDGADGMMAYPPLN